MLGTTFNTSDQGNTDSFSFKRPKLLSHQLKLQRQQILLLNTKTASSASILYEQDQKLEQLDDFIFKLSEIFDKGNHFNNHNLYNEEEDEKDIWIAIVLEGLEMFLRALRSIVSNHSQKLILKTLKFKLKLLTINKTANNEKELKIEECFDECLKMNGNSEEIESFEDYFGMNSVLDTLIGTKIMEFMFKKNLKEKIKICLEFQKKWTARQREDGGNENIQRELIKNVFESVKNSFDSSKSYQNILNWEVMLNLLEILMNSSVLDVNQLIDYCLIIFQGNRFEFLNNVNVFDKFLRFLNTPRIRNYQSFGSVAVTSFNSRIRSFLGKSEAKNENVMISCTKFVLEFFTIGIRCIQQFAEFLLKCQLIPINSIKNPQNRTLIYKLLKLYAKKTKSSLINESFNIFYQNLNNELKMELATYFMNSRIKGDYIFLNCSNEYFNENYMKIVETIIKRHINDKETDFDDVMMICIQNENENCLDEYEDDLELEYVLNFCKDNLLPIYLKHFKMNNNSNFIAKLFLKILSRISGLLLERGRISWTDLTGVLGPSVGCNNSLKCEGRAEFCFVYSEWLKLEFKNIQVKTLLRNVLNPRNSAELWVRSLFDFEDYGQVEFIKLFYNSSDDYNYNYLNSRIDCFKKLELPTKFMLEMMMKSIDFRSCHSTINLSFWNYLLEFGDFLIKSSSSLKGIICVLFTKYLPITDFKLILKFYQVYWQEVDEWNFGAEIKAPSCRDLMIRFLRNDPSIIKSHDFIKSLLKGEEWKTRAVFLDIFIEFISIESIEIEREVFLVQLALASAVPFVFTDQLDRNLLGDSLLTSLTVKSNLNLKLVYVKLLLLCELKLSFEFCYWKVNGLLIELCNLCGDDLEGYKEFILKFEFDYVKAKDKDDINKEFNEQINYFSTSKIIKGLKKEFPIDQIYFKNLIPILPIFNAKENISISPMDCLILLLNLLEGNGTSHDWLYNLKMFIKKRIMLFNEKYYESVLLFNLYFNK